MQHKAFVEATVLDAAPLPADMTVANMDLRGLREARELLMGRLRGDDTRRFRVEPYQPHREASLIDRMELHESGPGLVEQNIIAEMPDPLDDFLGIVDRSIIGALLNDRGTEW